ncbi:nitrate ABC transporter substrate-binding protein [Paenirhodobacter populi]|uniref:Nitrate ABC transporter substrate-binding protein n=1 Tax=Paenirhodobacter populi TaxID=2306993 RepID=A0A443K494_9RHOB|nr:nitrate ABC transporter substrate-binding protein [Sinirhodobacter populi]RWR19309.1 nitrate ABC transporter substrate-binding protein [Sinirhodobacter populi]RWR27607.1 nitrate ABC transporter substrate-binding protein [Sinirhodobacter populi]
MTLTLRLAVRDWDYVTPLALGDVTSDRLKLVIDRVGTLVPHLGHDPAHDAAETSFSRYTQLRLDGDDSIMGIPNFIMRGFRNRCVITREDSDLVDFAGLKGRRIGVTGWRDSGNTWTRALLRREGVGVEDAFWFAGRLTEKHPITDRLDGFGRPGRIEACPGERPMVDLLREGLLDAIFTPFMPEGFFAPDSGLRQVQRDYRSAEKAYFDAVGYVPGMHILSVKSDVLAHHPWVAQELSDMVDASQRMWIQKRRKYADTTPWMFEELARTAADLPEDWNISGLEPNRKMIADFAQELQAQGIAPRLLTPEDLFPAAI